jgi:hypothetical protein
MLSTSIRKTNRGLAAGRNPRRYLKNTPKPGELNDLLRRQDGGDQFTLRSGVNFIQMQLSHRFRGEQRYAFAKSAFSNEVGNFAGEMFLIGRRPFPENGRSIKFDLSLAQYLFALSAERQLLDFAFEGFRLLSPVLIEA